MATTTLMSFADFERLDLGAGKTELLKGEVLHHMPPAQLLHMESCERLYDLLKAAVQHVRAVNPILKLGKVHIEMGYRLHGDPASWLKPDVSLTHPDQPADRYYIGAPLIAFEVVSENDRAPELNAKVALYLADGSAEVWLFYPEQREAWVYEKSGTARQETQSVRTSLLPGIEIPFSKIF